MATAKLSKNVGLGPLLS